MGRTGFVIGGPFSKCEKGGLGETWCAPGHVSASIVPGN